MFWWCCKISSMCQNPSCVWQEPKFPVHVIPCERENAKKLIMENSYEDALLVLGPNAVVGKQYCSDILECFSQVC